jgi:TetR/AcrR family transcriptional repressor of nem operon
MSRYPAERKSETRRRILSVAEHLIKERGREGATVEAVMREAGLTVGGFYAHFPSKEALAQEALLAGVERSFARLVQDLDDAPSDVFALSLIRRYFAQLDDALGGACPLTVLLPDVARAGRGLREAFTARTGTLVAALERRLPVVEGMAPRDVALALFAALAGAVSLARASPTARGRRRIAAATEASLCRWLSIDAARVDAR